MSIINFLPNVVFVFFVPFPDMFVTKGDRQIVREIVKNGWLQDKLVFPRNMVVKPNFSLRRGSPVIIEPMRQVYQAPLRNISIGGRNRVDAKTREKQHNSHADRQRHFLYYDTCIAQYSNRSFYSHRNKRFNNRITYKKETTRSMVQNAAMLPIANGVPRAIVRAAVVCNLCKPKSSTETATTNIT